MRRRQFFRFVAGAAAAWPTVIVAQRATMSRIGVLVLTDDDGRDFRREFHEGLSELGYTEGLNVAFEYRSAKGNAALLPKLAADLVRLQVDVIAAVFTPCALAAKDATREIPVLVISVGDPVGSGLVASLSRPGGNVTGLSNMGPEAAGKCVDLLRDLLPSLRRAAVLANPVDPFTSPFLDQVQAAGRAAAIEIAPVSMVQRADELDAAFVRMEREQTSAVIVQGIFFSKTIADLAIKHRLASAAVLRSFSDAGGLLSYGADLPHLYRRSAALAQKILRGAKPQDLPVEQPTKFELAINKKTADAIGLSIPEAFLLRADTVIE